MSRRVVVTGLGAVTSIGLDVPSNWEALLAGRSGVAPITYFDASRYEVKVGAEVKGFDGARYMSPKEARRRDRVEQFSTVAANEALRQSGLEVPDEMAERVGVVFACGIGGLASLTDAVLTTAREGPRRVNVFTIPMIMPNGPAVLIAIDHNFRGTCYSTSSACASGIDAVGHAFELIARGELDAAVTGGAEATLVDVGIASFDRTGALSHRTDGTPAPFDRDRDGLVMGEGAGALVLEELEHARARGAEILAEVVGYGSLCDAAHITQPAPDGVGMAKVMRKALERARVNPEDVSYINPHGTATPLNDRYEATALNAVFGPRAGNIPTSSTKSMIGHCMSATGAIEAVYCVLTIRNGKIPPTINFHTPDPDCDLDCVPNEARDCRVDVVLNNAFGFGGHNAANVFRAFKG